MLLFFTRICSFFSIQIFTTLSLFGQNTPDLLIEHVRESIEKGQNEFSALSIQVLGIEGMSSSKVRHFLNNLCSFPQTSYLEVGCWKGSTLIASLYKNESSVLQAFAIDNWSEFGGPKEEFLINIAEHLPLESIYFFESDCFSIDKRQIFKPINVYFYDGAHDPLSQELAFTYFDDVFDDVFVAIVDDWNMQQVREGTEAAFNKLKYNILFEEELWTERNGDTLSWWNGIYIAVIKKN